MEETRYETLLDENTKLTKALSYTNHLLQKTTTDYKTLEQIHKDFKNQYEKLKKDNEEAHQKYLELLSEKKDLENQFDNTIRSFKHAIEQKQKELEDVQAKVIPSLDHDMIRIRIINELEVPHRQALEAKQHEIEKLQDQVYELKRQLDILNTKYEAVRFEAEKDIKDLKERHKIELNDLMIEIQTLHERVDDTKDKDVIRNLRRDYDQLKIKYEETENEMEELRREKERLREEKNDILIKLNKQIEVEKSDKRNIKTEFDKSLIKIRQFENEISHLSNKLADKESLATRLQRENEKSHQELEAKTKQIGNLQAQIRELEETQSSSQAKLQEFIAQTQLYDHEKHISEKNRISTLQREIESYQKTILDLENKNRNANFQMLKDLDALKQENERLTELHSQSQRTLDAKESEVKNLRREVDSLQDELYYTQKKNKELTLQRDDTGAVVKLGSAKDTTKDSQLLREALAREQKLKTKVVKLKTKLKFANDKIMELLPLKILSQQQETNQIFRDTATAGDFIETTFPRGSQLIENLKQKYGLTDISTAQMQDTKTLVSKYRGFGDNYQRDVDKAFSKYSTHPYSISKQQLKDADESDLDNEIQRAAEEGISRYGITPQQEAIF